MGSHLTLLELDELVAGLKEPPAHLEGCAMCRARVERLTSEGATFAERPEAKRQLAALTSYAISAPRGPQRSGAPWRRVAAFAVPLAAGLSLLFWSGREAPSESRLKGAPAVMLVDEGDHVVTHASAGQRLTLVLGGGDYAYAAVTAVSDDGSVVTLWPKDGAAYGALAPGARERLTELVVTPGDVTVKASFAREPRPLNETGEDVRTVRLSVQ